MAKILVIHVNDGVTGYACFRDQQTLTFKRGDVMYPNNDLSYDSGDPITMDAILFEDGVKSVAEHVRSILEKDPPEIAVIEGARFTDRKGFFPRPYELKRLCILSLVGSFLIEAGITTEVVDWKEEGSVDWYRSSARHLYRFDSAPHSVYELEACAVGLGYFAGEMEVLCRYESR